MEQAKKQIEINNKRLENLNKEKVSSSWILWIKNQFKHVTAENVMKHWGFAAFVVFVVVAVCTVLVKPAFVMVSNHQGHLKVCWIRVLMFSLLFACVCGFVCYKMTGKAE